MAMDNMCFDTRKEILSVTINISCYQILSYQVEEAKLKQGHYFIKNYERSLVLILMLPSMST